MSRVKASDSPEGRILYRTWKVGRKLGEGAQASVYLLLDSSTGDETGLVAKLAKYPDPRLPKKKAQEIMINVRILSLEKDVYRNYFNNGTIVPALSPLHSQHPSYLSGKMGNDYQYLVQERMDMPLFAGIAELIDSSGNASSVNLAPLAQQLFRNCESVHKKNHIMVDVKPDNIMFARGTAESDSLPERLRFVDLGLWKRYTSELSDGAKVGELTGNAMYCSLHMQELEKPVFRDDAQMMAIVLGEIVIRVHAALCNTADQYEKTRVPSYVPWAKGSNDQEVFRMKKDNLLKISSEFYKRMPPKAAKIVFDLIQLTHNTGARSQPDYVAYSNLLKNLAVPKPAKRKAPPARSSAALGSTASRKTSSRGTARPASAPPEDKEEGAVSRRVTRSRRSRAINSGSDNDSSEVGAQPSPRKRPAVKEREMVVELLSSDEETEKGGAEPMDIDETFDPFAEQQENVLNRHSNLARSSKPKAGIVLTVKRGSEELKKLTAYPGPTYSLGSKNAKATKSKIYVQIPGLSSSHCELKVNCIPSKPSKLLSVDFKHVAKDGSTKVDSEMLDPNNQSKRLEIAQIPSAQETAKKLRIGDIIIEFKQLF